MTIDSVAPQVKRQRPWLMPLIACVALTLAGAGYFAFGRTNYTVLFTDLQASDAAAIVTQLKKDGVAYRLAQGGATILVQDTKHDAAQLAIAGSGISLNGADGFELFNNADMGLTDFAQKIKYQRALQGELSRTIMMMEGVKEARVHLAIPERSVFRGEQQKGKAAVSITWRSPEFETPSQVWGIQKLVASSVPGLSDGEVVVLNGRGQVVNAYSGQSASPMTTPPSLAQPLNYAPSLTQLREIVGRTLTDQQFDVILEPTSQNVGAPLSQTADNSDTLAEQGGQHAATSNRILVITLAGISSGFKEQIKTDLFVASVIGENDQGLLVFQIDPNLVSPPREAAPSFGGVGEQKSGSAFPRFGITQIPNIMYWVLGLGLAALTLAVIVWAIRRLTKPAMSAQSHEEFAQILKQEFQARFKGATFDAS